METQKVFDFWDEVIDKEKVKRLFVTSMRSNEIQGVNDVHLEFMLDNDLSEANRAGLAEFRVSDVGANKKVLPAGSKQAKRDNF